MIDLAWLSLAALVVVVAVSCTTRINPGLLALVLAWLIGICPASICNNPIDLKQVLAGFPAALFLTLAGVTLLFALVQENGTLDRATHRAVNACGNGTLGSGLADQPGSGDVCTLDVQDHDGDGISETRDCDDSNPNIAPGQPELCDNIDNNCNGVAEIPWPKA